MMTRAQDIITLAYMNIRGQTGLDTTKQLQIEHFLKFYDIDILNCQEVNIDSESFNVCNYISSSYNIISNNASNKYGTCCLVASHFNVDNIRCDTNGRVILFDIDDMTFGNVYLPCGNDKVMRGCRENYCAEEIPQLLINRKCKGCIGGDWNSIICHQDATKNVSAKMSSSLKRLVKTFSWMDSYRQLYPKSLVYSRYYDHNKYGEGATRIDRQYYWGDIKIIEAKYVGLAFSDHQALVVKVCIPNLKDKLKCPKSKPRFKASPEVIKDQIFKERLTEKFASWIDIKNAGLSILDWWEIIVKPGIKSLLIQRGKEINKHKAGQLNLLLLRQSYLVRKLQNGAFDKIVELKMVQQEIQDWYSKQSEKIKIQAKCEEINSAESVRIYHHELHAKQIKKSTILKLETEHGTLIGHDSCAKYPENCVGSLSLNPPNLDQSAQNLLLQEVEKVFTDQDNEMMCKFPTKEEIIDSLWTSKPNAAPGTDGLTNLFYKKFWDLLGESFVQVAHAVHMGSSPTLSQRTSLMVYGAKANKPLNSPDPKHKRRISLLNSDFKIISGIYNNRFKKVATHTLNPNQYSVGCDRNIHHGISKARDAIFAASSSKIGVGILDNDYMAAFDYMVLTWVFKVLKAKGLDETVIERLKNLYENHLTVVVVNNISGKCYPNNRWSIRQGDRPSSILFCYGLDPHLYWLEKRLQGIPLPDPKEVYKLIAYVDDVKPSIACLEEFKTVDEGSALFEAASGCRLHRNPNSGKVKFLPLGVWRNRLRREDLPVGYVVIAEHLDMIGVKLTATFQKTRKINFDEIQTKVKNIIGLWKGGKFMPITERPHSVNTYCLSKVWFRCATLPLRVCDFSVINSTVKSWIYADQLEKPSEIVLFRPRKSGGLGLHNVKYKSLSLLLRSFLETSVNTRYKHNEYHVSLYHWYVEEKRDTLQPVKPPYYDEEFFGIIREAIREKGVGVLSFSSGQWYRMLVEKYITHNDCNGTSTLIPCKSEIEFPGPDWMNIWAATCISGLTSNMMSFLWRMVHNLLPCPSRLFRLNMPGISSSVCGLCNLQAEGHLVHCLFECPYNNEVGQYIIHVLSNKLPGVTPRKVVHLDIDTVGDNLPIIFFVAAILSEIWRCRMEKKPCRLHLVKADLEAKVNILRKSRHLAAAETLMEMFD